MISVLSIMGSFEGGIVKLLLAAILGGIIGWERERRGRPAGLRTHILVCVGVALMMIVSEHIFEKYNVYNDDSIVRFNPSRIAAQVIIGIGFLGAGTIMRFKRTVRGLTTAASLWVVAGIGLAVGSSCFLPAIFTTFIVLLVLFILPLFELDIKRDKYQTLTLYLSGTGTDLASIEKILKKHSIDLQHYGFEKDMVKDEIKYVFHIKYKDDVSVTQVSDEVAGAVKEIRKLGWD